MSTLHEADGGVTLSPQEAKEIAECLHKAAYAQLSMHRLAMEVSGGGELSQVGSIAIEELSRASMRRIDACIARIAPSYRLGNFTTEFETADNF